MDNYTEETQEAADLEQRLKAAVWYTVGKICNQEEKILNVKANPEFIASLAEVVYKQIETLAVDLEHFAKHAKRATISMEDVKLCARRNEGLHEIISAEANGLAGRGKVDKSSKKKK